METKGEKGEQQKATDALAQQSNPDLGLDDDNRATATLEVDAGRGEDKRALWERRLAISETLKKGLLEPGVYRGQGAHRLYAKPSRGALLGAPRGAPHVRLTLFVDYKPELCKDFKETGFCGFGDCCKFLHDRTDYKEGWQVEREWQQQQQKTLVRQTLNPKP
ncbi:zinc finger (CCCH type) protein, putative [Eimeria tenella]|uniref:Zinc finger (CCCH type) protein, putative n=1 Tax=Eimeria tenella TaxID=5802 RepID=U6L6S3_EIMTE|nr:zinc finger (CCCH type) protein, putative [Eimeria tenella]CDJ44289.1 zinc finger (CCCH type) protein, putative [Eimeria tenella]|eukprot:XP_013235038.1 zinc finger (CCCH type) protein, putative [Eimeria tenella]